MTVVCCGMNRIHLCFNIVYRSISLCSIQILCCSKRHPASLVVALRVSARLSYLTHSNLGVPCSFLPFRRCVLSYVR